MNVKDAKAIAFGSRQSFDLPEYFAAWQWLYDNNVALKQPDLRYLDKLICDGHINPREDYFENPLVE